MVLATGTITTWTDSTKTGDNGHIYVSSLLSSLIHEKIAIVQVIIMDVTDSILGFLPSYVSQEG